MTRVNKGARSRPKLICGAAKVGKGCQYRSVDQEGLDAALFRSGGRLVENIPAEAERGSALNGECAALEGAIDGMGEHLAVLLEALEAHPNKDLARRAARLAQEIETEKARLDELDEKRRLLDGGLIRERAYALAALLACKEEDADAPLEPINAALKLLFAGVVVDYQRGELEFQWRQGGNTRITYDYGFKSVEAEAPKSGAPGKAVKSARKPQKP